MNKGYVNIKNIIIVLLILVILLLRWCSPKQIDPGVVKTTVVETIKYDTIRETTEKYVPVPGPVEYDTTYLYRDIDTTAILRDYFASYSYSDTVRLDSVKVIVKDTVSQNKIKSRVVEYELLYPTKTVTITHDRYLNRREFYIGPAISGATDGFKFVGIESIYRSKKNTTFKVNAGVNENLGVQIGLGMHWKLKFK
jgi:hypothetical protein